MERRVIALLMVTPLATGCGSWFGNAGPPTEVAVADLADMAASNDRVMFAGTVSLLGELFCPCFQVTDAGASAIVWYDVPGEAAVDVTAIRNRDLVRIEGRLQAETDPGSGLPVVSAMSIEPVSVQLANPASVYCEEQGGTVDLRDSGDGTTGYCVFADGSECDEWAYFRGECAPGGG